MKLNFVLANGWRWDHIVLAMAHTLWEGAAIALLLWIFLSAHPARRARTRYFACTAALAAVIFSGMVNWTLLDRSVANASTASTGKLQTRLVSDSLKQGASFSPTVITSGNRINSIHDISAIPRTTLIGWTWAVCALVMLARTLVRSARAQRWAAGGDALRSGPLAGAVAMMARRMGIIRPIRLIVHPRWIMPAVMGFVFPTLLLPASIMCDLSAAQLQMVLAHELAHIRRWDYLINFWQEVVEAVLFFNPAVWWISRRIRIEREACCDASAVRFCGTTAAATTLADFAGRLRESLMPATTALGIAQDSGSALDRIKRIVRPDERPALSAPWYTSGAALVGVLIVLAVLRAGAQVAVTTAQSLLTPTERIQKIVEIQQAHEPAAEKEPGAIYFIEGDIRIVDGAPIPPNSYVNVHVNDRHGASGYSAGIDVGGHFRQEIRESGQVLLCVNFPGFAPAFAGPLAPDDKGRVPLVQINVDRGFPAKLKVTDSAGKPVSGANVTAVYVQGFVVGKQQWATDETGNILLEHSTSAIPVQVDVLAPGFEFERKKIPLSRTEVNLVKLAVANPTTGTVLDLISGKPIENARISLLQRKGFDEEMHRPGDKYSPPPLITATDSMGNFTLDTLRGDSQFGMWVSAPGHGSEIFFNIAAGQHDLVWKLGPPKIVHGKITGDLSRLSTLRENGGPAIRYDTYFQLPGINYNGSDQAPVTIENGVGSFELLDPIPGTLVFHDGGQSVQVDTDKIPALVELHIPAAQEIAARPAAPTRSVVLKFDVAQGMPGPQGKMRVFQMDPQLRAMMPKDLPVENGVVRTEAMAPGKLGYNGEGLLGYWTAEKMNIDIPTGNEPFEIHIPVVQAGAVHGDVLEADGKPFAAGFSVSIVEVVKSPAVGNEVDTIQPFNDQRRSGKFFLSPLPLGGTYRFVAWSNFRIALSDSMTIDAQSPIRDVTLKFDPGLPVRVHIVDADGHSRAGVKTSLDFELPNHGFGGSPMSSDRQGAVLFEKINPNTDGKYTLQIQAGDDYVGMEIPVQIDGKTVEVKLIRGLTLRGQVIDSQSGQPIRKAKITAEPQYSPASSNRQRAETTANDDGKFEFKNLDSFQYTFRVEGAAPSGVIIQKRSDGTTEWKYPDNWKAVEAHGGQSEEVILQVQPER